MDVFFFLLSDAFSRERFFFLFLISLSFHRLYCSGMLFQIGSLFLLNLLYRWICVCAPMILLLLFRQFFHVGRFGFFFLFRLCSINSQVIHWQTNVKSYCWNCYVQVYQRRRWCNLMSRHFNFFFIGFDDKRVDCWEFIEFFICSMCLCLSLAMLFYETCE